ncbi:alpha/beta fold hydrolase [Craterilacuibacter sp.]|uniref:alpha/beta fold hydrolase n=1 Tax=Craterilacuibacter sp. TaxID=2870909 RepID=UPI003F40A149
MYSPHHPTRPESLRLGQHHTRLLHWGTDDKPLLVLLHGWMDSAATFQFIADQLASDWHLVAPDLRGFGDSDWNKGSYYFPDYLADLDALLNTLSPTQPVMLAGHSMGAMIAGIYAGIYPERITRLMLIEGFGLAQTRPEDAPERYARWLKEQQRQPVLGKLESAAQLATKLQGRNPRMQPEHAYYMAQQLTRPAQSGVQYRADPRHKGVNPVLYRLDEAKACWRGISAPVQWVFGGDMWDHPMAKGVLDTLDERRACFKQLQETTISNAGHMVQWEQAEALAHTMHGFFSP